MTDDKADDISETIDDAEQAVREATPEAADTSPTLDDQKLSDLMARPAEAGDGVDKSRATAMEQEALAAAEQAVTDGNAAVLEAEQSLAQASPASTAPRGARNELVLRVLLAVNVVAMIVVALLPDPSPEAVTDGDDKAPVSSTAQADLTSAPAVNEPWNRALRASEQRDWSTAVTILDEYLNDRAEMVPSERLSVLSALSYYASQDRDFAASRRYAQQAQALKQSHFLPDDLVKEAEAARASGDQAALRRVLARFLLQQDEVPSHLYPHLVQSYLELGDSYREDAAAGARAARTRQMQAAAARLRAEALSREEKR